MAVSKMVMGFAGTVMVTAAGSSLTNMLVAWQPGESVPAGTSSYESSQVPGGWPNSEPAGMTTVLAVDGSKKGWPDFQQSQGWRDDRRVAVVKDPQSKYGYAIEKRYFVGDRSGWHGLTWTSNFAPFRELYQRIVFRVSPNWHWHSGGSKFFFWGSSGRSARRSPTQFYISSTARGQVQFTNQSASGEPDSRGTFRSIGPTISHDRYHTIEVLHITNTPGHSDGALRMWIDGVEIEGFKHLGRKARTNIELKGLRWLDYTDTRLTGLEAFMFWGGSGETKRVNDWIRVSELYVSGKN